MAKKAVYPLQVYVDHLNREMEKVNERLRQAQEALRQEEEKKAALEAALQKLKEDHERWMRDYWTLLRSGGMNSFDIESRKNHLTGLEQDAEEKRREVLAQERQVKKAEQAVEKVREEYLGVSNEIKIHEEKKEEWKRGLRLEEGRKEQRTLEDISIARHSRNSEGK